MHGAEKLYASQLVDYFPLSLIRSRRALSDVSSNEVDTKADPHIVPKRHCKGLDSWLTNSSTLSSAALMDKKKWSNQWSEVNLQFTHMVGTAYKVRRILQNQALKSSSTDSSGSDKAPDSYVHEEHLILPSELRAARATEQDRPSFCIEAINYHHRFRNSSSNAPRPKPRFQTQSAVDSVKTPTGDGLKQTEDSNTVLPLNSKSYRLTEIALPTNGHRTVSLNNSTKCPEVWTLRSPMKQIMDQMQQLHQSAGDTWRNVFSGVLAGSAVPDRIEPKPISGQSTPSKTPKKVTFCD